MAGICEGVRLEVVILAAGEGKRLLSRRPKALQLLASRPFLTHVLEVAQELVPSRIHVVVAPSSTSVRVAAEGFDVNWVTQEQPLGTAHAVLTALPHIQCDAVVLVMYVDMPLVLSRTLARCVEATAGGVALVAGMSQEPGGMGRIVRDQNGLVQGIVEAAEASESELQISEVNTGILCAAETVFRKLLPKLRPHGSHGKGETYLTDLVAEARRHGFPVAAILCEDKDEAKGANSRLELAEVERALQRRRVRAILESGVSVADPERVDIRGDITTGADCWLDINVVLEGRIVLGDAVSIGPGCVLKDVELESGVQIHSHSVVEGAYIGEETIIGPFTRIRRETEIGKRTRIGNFVEIKQATIGEGVKVNHLSYLGDATLGEETNVGAGAVTCNYDGKSKHSTVIGKKAFVGTNATLVAPLLIEDEAFIAAGSTITKRVKKAELAVGRSRQRAIRGWKPPWRR